MKTMFYAVATILVALTVGAAENRVATSVGNRTIAVEALTDNILRITNHEASEVVPESKTLVSPGGALSSSVASDSILDILTTATGLTARLNRSTGQLHISDANGNGLYDSGVRGIDSLSRRTMQIVPTGAVSAFFGAGERGHSFNLAGDTLVMYNRQNYGYTESDPRISQMNITMPLLLSAGGYAILVDDYAEAEMIAGSPLSYASASPAPLTYYFISSPAGFESLTGQVSDITGRQDLPPFWALGYITSKYGYKTQSETDSVVDTLKKLGYPLDGIVLDLYWYGKEQDMGRLEWDAGQWPDPQAMLRGLKDKGVNLIAISQPYVLRNGRGIDNYNFLSENSMFALDSVGAAKEVEIWVGEGGMLDVSNPDTRVWLRNRYKLLTDGGISGWWGDLGEPEVHPDGTYHANGLSNRLYHNLYGNDWSSIIYNLFAEEYPDTRLMTMMRGGTVGLQRYSVFPWSTDVSRSWEGLQPQIKIMLNSSLSGMGYMSHDVGGFAIDPDRPYDPELYVRWLQLGVFSPVLRTHAQDFAEPYLYPGQQDIILPLIRERYRWLPYNYTLAYENASCGMPLVRPVGMYASNPADYADVSDEFLWGRDVLVTPVLAQGAQSRRVRLPEGCWIDLNNPSQAFCGDTVISVDAPLHVLPMFVRAGALIPKADYPMDNTLAYDPSRITVDYYPASPDSIARCCNCPPHPLKSEFTMFDDDRTSTRTIERNQYALLRFSAETTTDTICLNASQSGSYPGMPGRRALTFVVHNVDAPRSVSATQSLPGQGSLPVAVSTGYDASSRTLDIAVSAWDAAAALSVVVGR